MGYEITMIIARRGRAMDEHERDEHGMLVVDEHGRPISTGRIDRYCTVVATVELSKCGWGPVRDLMVARADDKGVVHSFSPPGGEGNLTFEDRYGETPCARGLDECIAAVRAHARSESESYWIWPVALATLEAVFNNRQEQDLVVLLFGH